MEKFQGFMVFLHQIPLVAVPGTVWGSHRLCECVRPLVPSLVLGALI